MFLGCIVGCRYICNSLQTKLVQPDAMDHILHEIYIPYGINDTNFSIQLTSICSI